MGFASFIPGQRSAEADSQSEANASKTGVLDDFAQWLPRVGWPSWRKGEAAVSRPKRLLHVAERFGFIQVTCAIARG
jgi:hypothetical protein